MTVQADVSYLYCRRTYILFLYALHMAQVWYYDVSRSSFKWLSATQRFPPNGFFSMLLLTLISVWIVLWQIICGYKRIWFCKDPTAKDTDVTSECSSGNDVSPSNHELEPSQQAFYLEVETSFSTTDSVKKWKSFQTSFNYDSLTFVLDNCANVHIINDKEFFVNLDPVEQRTVATIGGNNLKPEKIGTALVRMTDDNNKYVTL